MEKRELISRFNLIHRMEQGSSGNTWLAHDEKLDRAITIKELDEVALESPQAWKKFRREASITDRFWPRLSMFAVQRRPREGTTKRLRRRSRPQCWRASPVVP